MNRIRISPRNRWQQQVEQLGFGFHSTDVPYWDESACYTFTQQQVEAIEQATATLWQLCLAQVEKIIDQKNYDRFSLPPALIPLIEQSWNEDHPSIYGRFDLCVRPDGSIKLLEFNADTPTSLFEAGIVQWFWLQDFQPQNDQFNSIHEKLIAYWGYLKPWLRSGPLHFTCVKESLEDLTNTEYLRDCAIQAGLDTRLVYIDDLGWDGTARQFVDMDGGPISNLFKLYPWEWIGQEEFAGCFALDAQRSLWIEPAWKLLLSHKAILPLLWESHPGHPLLLPAYFEPGKLTNFVKKPMLGREGANVTLVQNDALLAFTEGSYGAEGMVFQELHTLPCFDGNYPVVGSWLIGQEPAGIGIRESVGLITNNNSRFVPHMIQG